MKIRYIIFILVVCLSSETSKSQTLYSRCFPFCNFGFPDRSLGKAKVLNTDGEIIVSGYGSNIIQSADFVALLDSLANPIWDLDYKRVIYDTLYGIDTFMYSHSRFLRGSDKVLPNLFSIVSSNDSTVYEIVNGSNSFVRKGLMSSVLTLFDNDSTMRWSRIFGTDIHNYLYEVTASGDRLLYSGVGSNSYFQNGPSGNQLFVGVDTLGNVMWNKIIPGTISWKIVKTSGYFDNGFLVLSNDTASLMLSKLDLNGNIEWAFKYNGLYSLTGRDLEIAGDSTIYILAANNSVPVSSSILKVDKFGQLIWSGNYYSGLPLGPRQLIQNEDNIIKLLLFEDNASNDKNIITELDSSGFILNSNAIFQNIYHSSGSGFDGLNLGYIENQGNYFIGSLYGYEYIQFAGTSSSYFKIFRLDNLYNNCEFMKHSVSVSHDTLNILSIPIFLIDSTLNASLTSYDLDLVSGILPSTGDCISATWINDPGNTNSILITPNPTLGKFKIQMNSMEFTDSFELYNMQGQLQFRKQLNEYNNVFNIDLPASINSGIYLVRLNGRFPSPLVSKFVLSRDKE